MIDERFFVDDGAENDADDAWRIENDQEADWAIGKIKEAQAELDKWTRYYQAMTESIKARTERTVSFMTFKLSQYFETVPHKETKTQEKYSLPQGDLVLKKKKGVWVHDDAALLVWARENGFSDCIKVTEKISWQDVKKRLTEDSNGVVCDSETGVVCDAVKAETTEPEFVVMGMNTLKD